MSDAKSTDTRQALIDAAIQNLMTDGWASIRMRNLAASVGIRASSIYNHFKTKADLGLAIVAYLKDLNQDLIAAINRDSDSLFDRIIRFAAAEHSPSGTSCPVYNLQAEFGVLPNEMQRAVKDLVKDMLAALTTWIEAAQANGEISKTGDARTQAGVVLSACEHGLQLQRILGDITMTQFIEGWYGNLTTT